MSSTPLGKPVVPLEQRIAAVSRPGSTGVALNELIGDRGVSSSDKRKKPLVFGGGLSVMSTTSLTLSTCLQTSRTRWRDVADANTIRGRDTLIVCSSSPERR